MTAVYDRHGIAVQQGDCLDVMRSLPDASVHAVVTDPPYGLEFMGKEWDTFKPGGKRPQFGKADGSKFRQNMGTPSWGATGNPTCRNCSGDKYRNGPRKCQCDRPEFPNHMAEHMLVFQAWVEEWAVECLRVLTPGGYMLAFGGTRTFHRLASGIEDAGFEIRDSITWLYGSGFPKSLDVSKAIDKAAGAEREVIGPATRHGGGTSGVYAQDAWTVANQATMGAITAPATDAARQWAGWGTALKPASEPIIVARKPLSGTVAANVIQHGTGALNVDACRVGSEQRVNNAGGSSSLQRVSRVEHGYRDHVTTSTNEASTVTGRWPTNVVLSHSYDCGSDEPCQLHGIRRCTVCLPAFGCVDGCPVAELDAQSGTSQSPTSPVKQGGRVAHGGRFGGDVSGNPTRTGEGVGYGDSGGASRFFPTFRYEAKAPTAERPKLNGVAHPTVKPLDLMRWLVRLVTPSGGIVLDPFAGTGTTGHAARAEGFKALLIEQDADHIPLIVSRLDGYRTPVVPDRVTGKAEPMDLLDLLDGEAS